MTDTATSVRAAAARELLRAGAPAGAVAEEPQARRRRGAKTGDADAPDAKKSKKKLIMVGVLLLLVAFEAKGKFLKPHYGPGHPPPAGVIWQLNGSTITTNLSDGHLAQVGISLQLTKAANTKLINNDSAVLVDSTIRILSGENYSSLLGTTGRDLLSNALLSAYQRDLGTSAGGQQVSAVYFTSFVLQ